MQEDTNENEQTNVSNEEGDWFLRALVEIINGAHGVSMGMTLNVGGLLVSGDLVGGKEYFEGLAAEIAAKVPNEVGKSFANFFKAPAAIYEPKDGEGPAQEPPGYIHLKNARFFVPGQKPIPSNQGVWWRGRLSEVGGFMFGSMGVD